MRVAKKVTVRDTKKAAKQWNFRLPARTREYLTAAGKGSGRSMTLVALDAIELDRVLEVALASHRARLEAFAAECGLNLSTDFPRVIAELALLGLGVHKSKK